MIGIDLDGTLLDAHGNVSSVNREAIERAIDAGVIVVPCTGRGWSESRMALEQLPALHYGVGHRLGATRQSHPRMIAQLPKHEVKAHQVGQVHVDLAGRVQDLDNHLVQQRIELLESIECDLPDMLASLRKDVLIGRIVVSWKTRDSFVHAERR